MTLNQLSKLYPVRAELARQLGVNRATITKWYTKGYIPRAMQHELALLTNGRLKVDRKK